MKYIDILKKAEKIEKDIMLVDKPTKKAYGHAIRLTGDPFIEIMEIDNEKNDKEIEIDEKKYYIVDSIFIKTNHADKLINALQTLLEKEL